MNKSVKRPNQESFWNDKFLPMWEKWMKWETHVERDFAESDLISTQGLLLLRLFFFAFLLFADIYSYAQPYETADFIKYFTEQSFVLMIIYFGMASHSTWTVWQRQKKQTANPDLERQKSEELAAMTSVDEEGNTVESQELSTRLKSQWVLFELVLLNGLLTSVVYWTLIANLDPNRDTFVNHAKHTCNILVFLVEVFVNRLSVTNGHLPFLYGYLLLYMFFSWIWEAATGQLLYWFLETGTEMSPVFYLGLLFLYTFFLQLCRGICWLGNWVSGKMAAKEEEKKGLEGEPMQDIVPEHVEAQRKVDDHMKDFLEQEELSTGSIK